MKKLLSISLLICTFVAFGHTGNSLLPKSVNQVNFIENHGQWPPEVQFLVKMEGVNAWIMSNGIIYDYFRLYPQEKTADNYFENISHSGIRKGHVVETIFGSAPSAEQIIAEGEQAGYLNYFIGDDPSAWVSNVRKYQSVRLNEMFPGIDVELTIDQGKLRYDFVLQPYADPGKIKLSVIGADDMSIQNDNIIFKTSIGDQLQGDVMAFQGERTIDCHLKTEQNSIVFELGSYDKSKSLRIDPLVYSTYFGGSSDEGTRGVALGSDDAIYITGATWSADFPATTGAYQEDLKAADDVFVSGFSSDGKTLLFSTFLGGSFSDQAFSLAYNQNKLYLTGTTYSEDFPVTAGAFQDQNHLGGDVFVASISADGQSLDFSTYAGGLGFDVGYGIAVNDNIFVGGATGSIAFPVTADAFDNTGPSFLNDGFIMKLSLTGDLLYSSFFGGSGDDQIKGIAADPSNTNNYYVTGFTTSPELPMSSDAYDDLLGKDGSGQDAFVTEFSGNELVYSTFIGGTKTEYSSAIAVGANHMIMIPGVTFSDDFPVTADAFSAQKQGTYQDAFVVALSPDGNNLTSDLKYSTYFGGTFEEEIFGAMLEGQSKLYITGFTSSQNFPTTSGAISEEQIGNQDAFLTRFNFDGNNMDYSTYLGGSFNDAGFGIGEKQNGQVVLCGMTMSFNFPVTDDAYDDTYNSENFGDAFVSVIEVTPDGIDEQNQKNHLRLYQNVPNPFHTATAINYYLKTPGEVELSIYDLFGKKILSRKFPFQTAGEHQINIQLPEVTPGLYMYSVKSGKWSGTRKMVIK